MHCYKCLTTEDLSVKSNNRRKDGTIRSSVMVCRPCRRQMHRDAKPLQSIYLDVDWNQYAREKNERLMAKYS